MDEARKTASEIGGRIRAFRERAGLSSSQLANRLGVTEDAVARMQRGESVGQFIKLIAMADALNITPNDLLGFEGHISDVEVIKSAIEACFEALGVSELESVALGRIIIAVIEQRQAPPAGVEPQTAARIQAGFAVRQLLGARQSHSDK